MKSFSSHSFAGTANLDDVTDLLKRNPQALFTDFQVYLMLSKTTVFFTAYSEIGFRKETLTKKVAEMVALAPQLSHGFTGANPGHPFSQSMLDAITEVEMVDSFEGYPDKWMTSGQDVFDEPNLPLFRVKALVRRGGPDAEGRASLFLFHCAHALMEGSDSALLSRSQSAAHHSIKSKANRLPFGQRLKSNLVGGLSATVNLALAHASKHVPRDIGFATVALARPQIRRVAKKLGVGQRPLMYALVMHALNDGGRVLNPNVISTAYTMLDSSQRSDADDDFFRVNTVMAKFEFSNDLVTFARSVERTVKEAEAKDPKKMQFVMNAMFSAHRRWSRLFPFLYGPKFFAYGGKTDLVLTLIPPHRLYGNLARGFMEPVHAGAWHPTANLCTFVPGHLYATLNFSMGKHLLPQVPRIQVLLDELDRMPAPAAPAQGEGGAASS